MAKTTCHGCDGKGWIMVTVRETLGPYFNEGKIVEGVGHQIRVCEPRTCPICKGNGVVSRPGATIGESVQ